MDADDPLLRELAKDLEVHLQRPPVEHLFAIILRQVFENAASAFWECQNPSSDLATIDHRSVFYGSTEWLVRLTAHKHIHTALWQSLCDPELDLERLIALRTTLEARLSTLVTPPKRITDTWWKVFLPLAFDPKRSDWKHRSSVLARYLDCTANGVMVRAWTYHEQILPLWQDLVSRSGLQLEDPRLFLPRV